MSKKTPSNWPVFIVVLCLIGILGAIIHSLPEPPAPPEPPIVVPDFVPTPPVIPTPDPEPPQPKPRDIASEPTDALLAEWNKWRNGREPRTAEIQTVYETLLRRGVIRRDGEPVSSGGRRGRRR